MFEEDLGGTLMDHNDIRHKLSDYIDDALSGNEKMAIEAHLETCTICSDALAELRKTIEHVQALEEVESPPWMTGKIMARVRAEREKKGFFRRFFHPLMVNLPLQTVAVLFLAVTAYYLYQNINPAQKYAEAPMITETRKDDKSKGVTADRKTVPQSTAPKKKSIGQKPAYKSLDMKYEYEKPAAPVPQPEAQALASAPAPAKRPAQQKPAKSSAPGSLMESADSAGAPPAAAERAMDQAARAGFSSDETAMSETSPVQMKSTSLAKAPEKIRISLAVHDVRKAVGDVEAAARTTTGKIVGRSGSAQEPVIVVSLDAGLSQEFTTKLNTLGILKTEGEPAPDREKTVLIEITISPAPR